MIYVDDPMMYLKGKFRGYCHMWIVGGTHEELDTFAVSIGLKKEWAQEKQGSIVKDFYHYDLSRLYRERALLNGAQYMPLSDYIKSQREEAEFETLKRWHSEALEVVYRQQRRIEELEQQLAQFEGQQ